MVHLRAKLTSGHLRYGQDRDTLYHLVLTTGSVGSTDQLVQLYQVRQNDTGNEFFIIIEGTADITKTTMNGTEHVAELGPR